MLQEELCHLDKIYLRNVVSAKAMIAVILK